MKKLIIVLLLLVSSMVQAQRFYAKVDQQISRIQGEVDWTIITTITVLYEDEQKKIRTVSIEYTDIQFSSDENLKETSKILLTEANRVKVQVDSKLHSYNQLKRKK